MSAGKAGLPVGTFHDVDATGEPAQYVTYLDQATTLLQELKRSHQALLALRPGDAVLDVGCGTGDDVRAFAALVGDQGRAVGIDTSASMIAEARQRSEQNNLPGEFSVGEADHLDFPTNTFDGCWAERVLQHLAEPQRALTEMVRVAKSGGRIVVVDADHELLTIDAADCATTRAIRMLWTDKHRASWIGRQLFGLFHRVGLTAIQVQPVPVVFHDLGVLDNAFGVERAADAAVEQGIVTAEAAAAWMADLRERQTAGLFFACAFLFVAVGRKL